MENSVKPKKNFKHEIKNIIYVIIGSVILGVGTGLFLVPFNIVSGGVTGLAIVLNEFLGGVIPEGITNLLSTFDLTMMDVYVSGLTWLMFFAGLIILGKNFALKTLISSIFYPIFFTLATKLVDSNFMNGFFNLKSNTEHADVALILAAVCGGALVGAGCAITFLGGGSTGGVDIITLAVCKFFPKIKSSVMMFIVDATVVILGMFAIGDLSISLLGIASAMVCAVVIDYLFVGQSKAFMAQIISDNPEEINLAIRKELNRTTTIMSVKGGYTGEEKTMVMVLFTIREYSEILKIVNTVDKNAFLSVTRAHEINGEGWTYNTQKSGLSKQDAKNADQNSDITK